MKQYVFLTLFVLGMTTLNAQNDSSFQGETRRIPKEYLLTPYAIEVTFDKTVHLLFPEEVIYVDLGSNHIIAAKADGIENVIRVKAAVADFQEETNFTVICDDGSFYSFNARYAGEPGMLNIDMRNSAINTHNRPSTVYLTELGKEPPKDVNRIMQDIYKADKKLVRHLGSKQQKIQFIVKGIFVSNGLFYFHTMTNNRSHVPFEVEYIKFKIADKKRAKRTPTQELTIEPVRILHEANQIKGKSKSRTVFALPKFTLTEDQVLIIELIEKNGGRHQNIQIESTDITHATRINPLKNK